MDRKTYYEITMEGTVDFIRGFLLGLLEGKRLPDEIFTGSDYHIEKRDGHGFIMKFIAGGNDVCTFVVSSELKDVLISAIEKHSHYIPFEILEIHPVESASFDVSFTTYSAETGSQLKELFNHLPEGILWEPKHDIIEKFDTEGIGIEAYTPLHEYELSAKGNFSGYVKGVFIIYHELKKYEVAELGEIKLVYSNDPGNK